MYTGRYQVLCHRPCVNTRHQWLGCFSKSQWPGRVEYVITTPKEPFHCLNIRRATWRTWRATWHSRRATWRSWRATWRSQKATWRCAMLERARRNTVEPMLAQMYTRCPCRDDWPIPLFNQWRAEVGMSGWRHRDGLLLGRHSEAYTLCEIRRKFNQLGLPLFKAFIQYAVDAFLLFWCV